MEPTSGFTIIKLLDWVWAAVFAVGGVIVKIIYGKFSELDAQLLLKADKVETDRQRETIVKLFDVLREHETEDRSRHEQLLKHISEQHQRLFDRIADNK
jgi:hypothetical protein